MKNFILNSIFFDQSVVRLPKAEIDPQFFKGSNQKNILIVCTKQTDEDHIDVAFLEKILASVSIDLTSDTACLFLLETQHFSWKAINDALNFEQLIYFGKSLKNLGLQVSADPYSPTVFQNKTLLLAEPLELIAADRGKKGALWNGLKATFNG